MLSVKTEKLLLVLILQRTDVHICVPPVLPESQLAILRGLHEVGLSWELIALLVQRIVLSRLLVVVHLDFGMVLSDRSGGDELRLVVGDNVFFVEFRVDVHRPMPLLDL